MAWSIFSDGGGPEVAVGWAEQLLGLIGAPKTPGNIEFVYQWEKSEGGGGKYNPLNQGPDPGHPTYTTTGQQYGGGAADYASWQAGLYGARDYLNMPAYSGVRDALLKNDPSAARSNLFASPWAASHYGYGSSWYSGTVPGGQAVMPPAGGGAATLTSASGMDPATCVFGIPGFLPSWWPGGSGGGCLLSKSQVRALLAGGMFVGGTLIMLPGAAILILVGAARVGRPVVNALIQVPVAGRVVKAGTGGASSSGGGGAASGGASPDDGGDQSGGGAAATVPVRATAQ